jgi:hypothetical protein
MGRSTRRGGSAAAAVATAATAAVVLLAGGAAATRAPPLPHLNLAPGVVVSGISSGADFAAQFHVANSDLVVASAIFAGQPPLCAVMRFDGEPLYTCAQQPATQLGPGCVGLNSTGPAPCVGCPPNTTLLYDHCKKPADGPGRVQVGKLTDAIRAAGAAGQVPPLAALAGQRVYLYRGTLDETYMAGSVNKTRDFFDALGANTTFETTVPSGHCQPTADPAISPSSCGGKVTKGVPPAMENCGYDGAGAALQWAFSGALTPPASVAFNDTAHLHAYDQSAFFPAGSEWAGGLASTGYVYVPEQCAGGSARPCRLVVALHGCGMSAESPAMGLNFTRHAGFNPWAASNDLVVLYPQGGGFIEANATAPSAQIAGGCWDGYGQTGTSYAFTAGPQVAAVRAMVRAVMGAA